MPLPGYLLDPSHRPPLLKWSGIAEWDARPHWAVFQYIFLLVFRLLHPAESWTIVQQKRMQRLTDSLTDFAMLSQGLVVGHERERSPDVYLLHYQIVQSNLGINVPSLPNTDPLGHILSTRQWDGCNWTDYNYNWMAYSVNSSHSTIFQRGTGPSIQRHQFGQALLSKGCVIYRTISVSIWGRVHGCQSLSILPNAGTIIYSLHLKTELGLMHFWSIYCNYFHIGGILQRRSNDFLQ